MNTRKKLKVIGWTVLALIIVSLAVSSYYFFVIYHPLFASKGYWFEVYAGNHFYEINDLQRNAGRFDRKNNMVLVLALPNHHKGMPLNPPEAGYVVWRVRPQSKSFAEFCSIYGHAFGVRRHKNSFVVIDGMTGEELVVHPITIEEGKQWNEEAHRFRRNPDYSNLLEWSFDFFSLPKEKFHEINEKIQQHDTSNERERGDGFAYTDDGKIEVTGP